jgi:hypothetical protein
MKHLKIFEKYQQFEEIEDFFLELIENKVLVVEDYHISRDWEFIEAVYCINLKKNMESIDDLNHNIEVMKSLINPIKFAGLDFKINDYDELRIKIPCSDNIKEFISSLNEKIESMKHLSGWVIGGDALIGVKKLSPNQDFSINVTMQGESWGSIKKINDNPNFMKELQDRLSKYKVEDFRREYRSELDPYGPDYYYYFTIR